jgi:hypothetical protein
MKNAYKLSVENLKGRDCLGDLGYENVDWI